MVGQVISLLLSFFSRKAFIQCIAARSNTVYRMAFISCRGIEAERRIEGILIGIVRKFLWKA